MVRKITLLLFCPTVVGIYGGLNGLTVRQSIVLSVFLLSIMGTFLFWERRLSFVFLGSAILFLIGGINIEQFIRFASLDVIIFLIGMMIVVGVLKESGVFHWLATFMLRKQSKGGLRLYITITVFSAVLSALTGEVTSIIVMVVIILEISDSLEITPVPLVISSVLTTNIGSSATVLGNPIGILIALRAGLSFEDFLSRALPVSVFILAVIIFVLCLWYGSYIKELTLKLACCNKLASSASHPINIEMVINLSIFCLLILLLGLHRRLELLFGFDENRLLIVLPILFAGRVLIFRCKQAHYCIAHEVEWKSLLFFIFLFAQAGIIQTSGVAQVLAEKLVDTIGNRPVVISGTVLISSGLLSGVLDNTVVVSSFVPIVKHLHSLHFSLKPLWWCVLFGACFGGNITAIGSSANIVALGLLEKQRNVKVNFLEWIKIGSIVAGVSFLISYLAVIVFPAFSQ